MKEVFVEAFGEDDGLAPGPGEANRGGALPTNTPLEVELTQHPPHGHRGVLRIVVIDEQGEVWPAQGQERVLVGLKTEARSHTL